MLHHNSGTWVLCDYGSTSSWSGHYEGSNDILVAEEDIRKHTTPAYRAPEVSTCGPSAACLCELLNKGRILVMLWPSTLT